MDSCQFRKLNEKMALPPIYIGPCAINNEFFRIAVNILAAFPRDWLFDRFFSKCSLGPPELAEDLTRYIKE
jgi:hypothetical protein